MKTKSPSCSTGHGTGVLMPASLHTILQRDKMRKRLKQRRRFARHKRQDGTPDTSARQERLDAARERQKLDVQRKQQRESLWGRMKTAAKRFLSRVK